MRHDQGSPKVKPQRGAFVKRVFSANPAKSTDLVGITKVQSHCRKAIMDITRHLATIAKHLQSEKLTNTRKKKRWEDACKSFTALDESTFLVLD
jgi:hypothetical protein